MWARLARVARALGILPFRTGDSSRESVTYYVIILEAATHFTTTTISYNYHSYYNYSKYPFISLVVTSTQDW